MARKTKAQALETRHQILDAAIVLFSQQGVSATSLADIATAASVTRGAIYWHFKNKADVLHEIWLRCDAGLDDVELEYQTKYSLCCERCWSISLTRQQRIRSAAP